jgi:DNA invertase Pin-like site-specific DNA recombinase
MRGLHLAEIVADEGVSADKPLSARPGCAAVLAAVCRQDAAAVVAYKVDRLFRDFADCLTVTRAWDGLGAALHLVDLGGQPSTRPARWDASS